MRSLRRLLGGRVRANPPGPAGLELALEMDGVPDSIGVRPIGKGPTGLPAVAMRLGRKGPELRLEVSDIAWHPYELGHEGELFPVRAWRQGAHGPVAVPRVRAKLVALAKRWDDAIGSAIGNGWWQGNPDGGAPEP
jgi:hypothetical protein